MRIFEPHIHMFSRTTDDYENLAMAGVRGICEPAFWLGQPRTNSQPSLICHSPLFHIRVHSEYILLLPIPIHFKIRQRRGRSITYRTRTFVFFSNPEPEYLRVHSTVFCLT